MTKDWTECRSQEAETESGYKKAILEKRGSRRLDRRSILRSG